MMLTSQELEETFTRVTGMLESELPSEDEAAKQGNLQKGTDNKMPPTSHTLIDLLIAMSIYLPRTSFANLFRMASVVLNRDASSDPQLTKKAYKLIPRLASTETGQAALIERSAELQALLLATANNTPSPARRDRLLAIHELVSFLPTSDLHFIPSILPEVILGCKESNDKARTAAFDLLIHLAGRITDSERNPPGTVIRNSLVAHMPDDTPDAAANLEEFFTMVSAGLAGTSPHMVAASVTALSRLFFEFRTQITPETLSDLVATVELFLTSNNREIVRSVLGFAKVAVVCLPDDMLRPRLASLVPNLMVWSKEHKGRLRTKVKGILDRLVRRFGGPLIEGLVGEADRKLVVNIRKERERKKRKRKEGGADEDEDDTKAGGFSNEFDKAVYGSDVSDSDADSDSDDAKPKASKGKRGGEQYIRELSPSSNPLDLLAPDALASISTTKPSLRFLDNGVGKNRKKHGAKVDVDGKLILRDGGGDEDDADAGNDVQMTGAAGGSGINAYLEAVGGPNAVRRGQKGRLKFSKKGDGMDIDEEDDDASNTQNRKQAGGSGSGSGIAAGRRGLGVPKTHGASRVEKRRSGSGGGFVARGRGRGGGRGGGRGRGRGRR
jgi:ribosomal RNA-processing protein 12